MDQKLLVQYLRRKKFTNGGIGAAAGYADRLMTEDPLLRIMPTPGGAPIIPALAGAGTGIALALSKKDKDKPVTTETEEPKPPEQKPPEDKGPDIASEIVATEVLKESKDKIKNKITTWEDHFPTIEEATKAAEDVGGTLREFEEGVIQKKITFRKTEDGFVILFDRKVIGELVDITQFKQEDNTQIGNTRSYQMSVINEDGTKGEPYDTFDGGKNAKDFAKDDVAKALLTETKDPTYPSLRDIFQNLEYNKKGEPKAIAEELERFRKELAER